MNSQKIVEKFLKLSIEKMLKIFWKVLSEGNPEVIFVWAPPGISGGILAWITKSNNARISRGLPVGYSVWIPKKNPGHIPADICNGIPRAITEQICGELLECSNFRRNLWKIFWRKKV